MSEALKINPNAIRFYEKKGLLSPKQGENNYQKQLAIAEMDRVLKPKATIIIADLMFENQAARNRFQATCSEKERLDLEDEYFGNIDEVTEILNEFGYKCRAEQIDELIWLFTANK